MIEDFILTLNKDDGPTGRTGNTNAEENLNEQSATVSSYLTRVLSLQLLSCTSLFIFIFVMNLDVHLAHLLLYNHFEGTVSTQLMIC